METKDLQALYADKFDSKKYLQQYYTELDPEVEFFLANLHNTFQSGHLGGKTSKTVLEIGCGPTVTSVISASGWSNHIICSDYVEGNRQEVRHWLEDGEGAMDWTEFFKFVAGLEGTTQVF